MSVEYNLTGIGQDVRLSKRGGRVYYDKVNNKIEFYDPQGTVGQPSDLIQIEIASPINPNDAVNLTYLPIRQPAKFYATAQFTSFTDITPATLNGNLDDGTFTAASGDRVLVNFQAGNDTTAHEDNGIYEVIDTVSGSPGNYDLVRVTDFNEDDEIYPGSLCAVFDGNDENDTLWLLSSPVTTTITVGTTQLLWKKIGGDGVAGGGQEELITGINYSDNNPAITGWVANVTTKSQAIDQLNETLGKLLPPQPGTIAGPLNIASPSSTGGSSILVASSIPTSQNNTINTTDPIPTGGSSTAPNTVVFTSSATLNMQSETKDDLFDGETSTVTAFVNDGVTNVGQVTLDGHTNGVEDGLYTDLRILNHDGFPASGLGAGFWSSFDTRIEAAVPVGYNRWKIDVDSDTTGFFNFWVDDVAAPTANITSLANPTPTVANEYSSGLRHFGTNDTIDVSWDATNLSKHLYLSNDIYQLRGEWNNHQQGYDPGQAGLANPIAYDTTADTVTNETYTFSGSAVHTTDVFSIRARNPRFTNPTRTNYNAVNINTMIGSPTDTGNGPVIELDIPVLNFANSSSGRAQRAVIGSGDYPDLSTYLGSLTTATITNVWNDYDPTVAVATHEAVIRGGVARHDQTDYTSGAWQPSGINYSTGRAGDQYLTFAFQAHPTNNMRVKIRGSWQNMYVKLPGIPNEATNSNNDWWDAHVAYAGSGIPGDGTGRNGSFGCCDTANGPLMNGTAASTTTFVITFGQQSTLQSTDNMIFIRFKMNSGDSIDSLRIDKNT